MFHLRLLQHTEPNVIHNNCHWYFCPVFFQLMTNLNEFGTESRLHFFAQSDSYESFTTSQKSMQDKQKKNIFIELCVPIICMTYFDILTKFFCFAFTFPIFWLFHSFAPIRNTLKRTTKTLRNKANIVTSCQDSERFFSS